MMLPVILRTLLFTVLAPGSVTIGIPFLLLSSGAELHSYDIGVFRFIGTLPMAVGLGFYIWCAADFAFVGRGTPAPIDAPKTLVSSGLYRTVRNPMYVGVELVLVGEALVFQSLTLIAYALVVWLMFHLFVVLYEEPTLRRKSEASYEAYCRAAPRWLPRIGRSQRTG